MSELNLTDIKDIILIISGIAS